MSIFVGAVLSVVGAVGLLSLLVSLPGSVSVLVAERVPARLARLTPGMTEAQALAALGLAGRVHPAIGNGPWEDYELVYPLRPGMNLALTLDMPPAYQPPGVYPASALVSAKRSARLVRAEVGGTDNQDRWTIAVLFLLLGLGLRLLSRIRSGSKQGHSVLAGLPQAVRERGCPKP